MGRGFLRLEVGMIHNGSRRSRLDSPGERFRAEVGSMQWQSWWQGSEGHLAEKDMEKTQSVRALVGSRLGGGRPDTLGANSGEPP